MDALDELIGEHPRIVALRQKVRGLLQRHRGSGRLPPVLIQGETGSGKGLLARLMHRAGPRASGPFVDLNCAAIPENLLEAELFGYERGAFTDARQAKPGLFHVAHGGTLFLDEIGLLPRGLQAKLLTVLEQGSVRRLGATRSEPANVSIIAATNESLQASVQEGRFREDLYHRLAVLTIELPPLRERRDDVEPLAERLLAHVCAEYKMPAKTLALDARAALRAHDWPGNVRELSNVIERAALLSDTDTVTVEGLDLPGGTPARARRGPVSQSSKDTNRERLIDALEKTSWNVTRTAALLGITRNTVRAWVQLYGLRDDRGAEPRAPARPDSQAAAATTVTSPAPAPLDVTGVSMRWEQRRITFLRARILAAADAPAGAAARVLDRLVEKVQSFGGRVDELNQRSILAVFGHEPTEDAPRRAANVALAIAKTVERERLAGTLPAEVSLALSIHVGRAALTRLAGRAVIDQDTLRQAAQVLDTLEPVADGEIAVSDGAIGFLAHHFDVDRPAGARAGHRLVGRGEAAGGAPAGAFVGRRQEIEFLRGLLDRTMMGQGQMVTLVGEPGIGKSRLLREFHQAIRAHDVVTLQGRCAAYGAHVPYFPVLEILQAVCDIEEADTPETIDTKVRAALQPLGPGAAASAPYLRFLLSPRDSGELSGRSPEAIKVRTFEALQQLLVAQQERTTLIVAVEDLHWIDHTSQDLLASLAEIIRGTRVLLITTSRPGYQPPWGGQSNATQVAVGPLSASESRRLVDSILGAGSVGEGVLTKIVSRADGNPFFLEELARSLGEQHEDAETLAVPATVHDVVASRIDGLPDADKQILDIAAVIGRDLAGSLVQDLVELSPDELRAGLRRLQSGEFLHPTRFGPDAEYTFKHALTLDVAYASVPEAARSGLHARVAASIQKLAPETGERRPEILARHYTEAGRPVEAIDYWHRAGRLAIQRSAHVDAIAHLTRALKLLETQPDDPRRAAQEVMVQLALANSLTATRGYAAPEVERTLARIRVVTERLGETAQQASVRWSLWRFYFARAEFRAAEELAHELLVAAERQNDDLLRVGAQIAAGIDKFYMGELARAREHFEAAVGLYDGTQSPMHTLSYGQDLGVAARGFLGWTQAMLGDLDGGVEQAQRAIALAREVRHPFSLVLTLLLSAEIHELRREPDVVRPLGEEMVALAREQSLTFYMAIGLVHSGWGQAAGGELDEGIAVMRQGAELYRSVGHRVGLAHRARMAEALIAAGALVEALGIVDEALAQSDETEERAFASELLRLQGEVRSRQGDAREARSLYGRALELAERQGAIVFALRASVALARVDPGARDTLGAILARFPRTADSSDLRAARAVLGEPR